MEPNALKKTNALLLLAKTPVTPENVMMQMEHVVTSSLDVMTSILARLILVQNQLMDFSDAFLYPFAQILEMSATQTNALLMTRLLTKHIVKAAFFHVNNQTDVLKLDVTKQLDVGKNFTLLFAQTILVHHPLVKPTELVLCNQRTAHRF
jgi:hypothetical protein